MGLIGVSGPTFITSSSTTEPSEYPGQPHEKKASLMACTRVDTFLNSRKRRPESENITEPLPRKRLRATSQPPSLNYSSPDSSFLNISDDEAGYATDEDQPPKFDEEHKTKPTLQNQMEIVYAADEEDVQNRQRKSSVTESFESSSPREFSDDETFHDMSSALYGTLELIIKNANILRQGGESIIKNANTMKSHAMNMKAQLEIELRCEMKAAHKNETPCSCGANTPGSVLNIWRSQFEGGFLPNGMDFAGLSQTLGALRRKKDILDDRGRPIVIHEEYLGNTPSEGSPSANYTTMLPSKDETQLRVTMRELALQRDVRQWVN
ncbi:hypothetical protein TWF730_005882 [Orbilia blumenaviensis]|uniref:Phosphoprotein n=1 Tax=Orbilia blumenaviensis TaxID=1796055 RepID=A0AAV9VJN5_9PEZI